MSVVKGVKHNVFKWFEISEKREEETLVMGIYRVYVDGNREERI